MRNQLVRFLFAGILGVALAGGGVANAQMDDDDDMGMDDDDDMGMGGEGTMDDDDDMGMGGEGTMDDDDDGGEGDGATAGDATAGGEMPFLTPEGKLIVAGSVMINLSSDQVFKPLSLNPDFFYGLMPKLEVGLVHSPQAYTGFFGPAGGGLCVTGEDNGCADVYGNPGLLGRYEVMNGDLQLAAEGGLLFVSLSDFTLSLKLGAVIHWSSGKIHVWTNPNIWLGLTDRSVDVMGVEIPINKERLHLPLGVGYAVNEQLMAGVQTGIAGFLDGFGDSYRGALSFVAMYMLNEKLGIGGAFNFDNLYGEGGGGDARSLNIMFHYAAN
jgi:hypothetical protein